MGFNQLAVSGPAIYHTKHAITPRGCHLRLSVLTAKLACSYLPMTQLWHLFHLLHRALSQICSGFDQTSLCLSQNPSGSIVPPHVRLDVPYLTEGHLGILTRSLCGPCFGTTSTETTCSPHICASE